MIGRADIEGSKSNVAKNAWLPQASYPCELSHRRPKGDTKGSIGLAFTRIPPTEKHPQASICPFALPRVSPPSEAGLGAPALEFRGHTAPVKFRTDSVLDRPRERPGPAEHPAGRNRRSALSAGDPSLSTLRSPTPPRMRPLSWSSSSELNEERSSGLSLAP
ncbi:PREDICTED: uncharacterized protein LOC105315352 [Amphimedon queenslandica]|uniref:Uncharacterized protein n=1 Tax=Amphimedon queenslandica TaxID=400682 RepID=A0AAN0IRA8_AMPQE|nr:PREDICTED: uncharacterized protein LOC105315352 [Amphimedon queenslandica]|eukprot:XP_011408268.1 PREDICTED: uncharacterized protein LOC105315352 [Amphimedon queenslandica]